MHIRGINEIYTKGANEVAFDLSEHPDATVMSRVKLADGVNARAVDGVLILKTEYEPLPLKSTHVDAFVDAYHRAEGELRGAERKAEAERRAMLGRISQSLNLPLTSQATEDD
jgi:hypothetical protein